MPEKLKLEAGKRYILIKDLPGYGRKLAHAGETFVATDVMYPRKYWCSNAIRFDQFNRNRHDCEGDIPEGHGLWWENEWDPEEYIKPLDNVEGSLEDLM